MRKVKLLILLLLIVSVSVFSKVNIYVISDISIYDLPFFSKAKTGDYIIANDYISVVIGSKDRNDGLAGKIIEAYDNETKRTLIDEYKIFIQNKISSPSKIKLYKTDKYAKIEFEMNDENIQEYYLEDNKKYIEIKDYIYNKSSKKIKIMVKDIVSFKELFPIIIKTNENGKKVLEIQENFISYGISSENTKIFRTLFTKNFGAVIYKPVYINPDGKKVFSRRLYISKNIEDTRKEILSAEKIFKGKIISSTEISSLANLPVVLYDSDENMISLTYTNSKGEFSFSNVESGYYISIQNSGFSNKKIKVENPQKFFELKTSPIYNKNIYIWPVYLTNHTENSVILNWKTMIAATADIKIYNRGELIKTIYVKNPMTIQHIPITGLVSGEKYIYEVNINNYFVPANIKTVGEFKTKSLNEDNLVFAIYGDTRTYHELHKMVCDEIAEENPEFVINVGDLVEKGDYLPDWDHFFNEISDLAEKSVYYPLLGNHERNSTYYYEAFYLPQGSGDYDKRWYSFKYGNLLFVFLDSNAIGTKQLEDAQLKWLKELFEKNKDMIKLVFFHHPFWNNAVDYYSTSERHLEEIWRPLFEKYDVKAVFNGHVHSYERHEKNGIIYVITGGGGAPLEVEHKKDIEPTTVKLDYGEYHYIIAKVEKDKIIFKVIGVGHIIDKLNTEKITKHHKVIDTFEIKIK